MNRAINPVLPILILAAVVTSAVALTGGGYDLTWNTFDGGGATFSTGGGYELGGTIGQHDAGGPMTGGGYELTGGFWPGATVGPTGQVITAAFSKRTHGASGDFSLPLSLASPHTREPRAVGSAPGVRIQFSQVPVAADGTLSCNEFAVVGGSCTGVTLNGSIATVALSGLVKNTCLTVTVNGITGLAGDNNVSVILHEGNVDGTTAVNILDLQAIKNQLIQAVGNSNFHLDVNCSGGAINILDLQVAKNNLFQPASCP